MDMEVIMAMVGDTLIKKRLEALTDMKKILGYLFVILAFTSCAAPKEISYFQDVEDGTSLLLAPDGEIRIQPEDKLSIYVKTRDQEISQLFNIGYSSGGYESSTYSRSYVVDSRGYIDFPELGDIFVKGKTREEVEDYIKFQLESRNLVKKPTVFVDFREMYYTVLGEINPGRRQITKDHTTILEAIAESGDLRIDALRTNVLVMRKSGDEMKSYRVNLVNAEELYKSPVYYIQQGDVIYIEANAKRQRQSTVEGNNFQTIGFWMSMFSFAVGVLNLIF